MEVVCFGFVRGIIAVQVTNDNNFFVFRVKTFYGILKQTKEVIISSRGPVYSSNRKRLTVGFDYVNNNCLIYVAREVRTCFKVYTRTNVIKCRLLRRTLAHSLCHRCISMGITSHREKLVTAVRSDVDKTM